MERNEIVRRMMDNTRETLERLDGLTVSDP